MGAFRVVPVEVVRLAGEIDRTVAFAVLADSAQRLGVLGHPGASSTAIDRFKYRLMSELAGLATATGSLGRATRSAAAGYQQVEDSIRSMSTR